MSWGLGIDLPMPFETRLIAHEYALGVDVPVVRSSDEAWEALAQASEEFADALEDTRRDLQWAVRVNVFGDCVEGQAMFDRVNEVVVEGQRSILSRVENHAEALTLHATSCRSSVSTINQADSAD